MGASCFLVPKFPFGNAIAPKASACFAPDSLAVDCRALEGTGGLVVGETEFQEQVRSQMEIWERGDAMGASRCGLLVCKIPAFAGMTHGRFGCEAAWASSAACGYGGQETARAMKGGAAGAATWAGSPCYERQAAPVHSAMVDKGCPCYIGANFRADGANLCLRLCGCWPRLSRLFR